MSRHKEGPPSALTLAANAQRGGLIQAKQIKVNPDGSAEAVEAEKRYEAKKKRRIAHLAKSVSKLPRRPKFTCCGGRSWHVGSIETLAVEWQELKDERFDLELLARRLEV